MTLLAGRLAVVTGGSRGIGLATAKALAANGATVVRLARSLAGSSGSFHDIRCDLSDTSQIVSATTRLLGDWGVPQILVNNAGGFLLRPFEETEPNEFEQQLTLNLRAPFLVAQGLLPAMRAAGRGTVVTVGSVADHVGFPGNAAYAATKYGLRGLHETLAAEYRGTGLRFTLVSPGPTDTAVWDSLDPDRREGFTPRAEMLHPEDVADAIVFAVTRPPHATVEWLRLMPTA
jgi:NAD(P)-dependent dehydrogenase (short-subunit alcohol dehydrogenase family)